MLDAPIAPPTIRLADYKVPDWLVPSIALRFELDAVRTRVHARLTVGRNGAHARPLVLDGEDLTLISVMVDGVARDAVVADGNLVLTIDGDSAVVETVVEIEPAKNTVLMGLYASGGKLCTQCEAEGFRRITFFPDRPDVLSKYSVRLEADAALYPILLSNGDRGPTGALPDGRHFAEWNDPWPKPAYLFAIVAGDLGALRDRFVTASGRDVALAIWTDAADLPRCTHAMAALKASFRWDEVNYGREYDLDEFNIVAVSDFNAGAMENKGLNIFNSKYILADQETATDDDFDAVAAVVAHEYFHNWTGNRITCRDWFQLSLKEGLTVFRDQQFSGDQGSRAVNRIDDVRMLRGAQFPEDAGPMAHPIRPNAYIEIGNFYTSTVYNKGAEVIRMLATMLGEKAFRAGTDLYFDRFDGQAVTTDDWLSAMAEASGRDLGSFKEWYNQAGTPRISAELAYDADAKAATLRLTQAVPTTPGQPVKVPMAMPFRVALFGRDSGERLGDERVVTVDGEASVRFEGVSEAPVMSLNRGFSAPVIVDTMQSRSDLAFLAAHDDDPFARWEATQRLALDVLSGDGPADDLVATVAATLDAGLDPEFTAEAILLPTESVIGDHAAIVDVDAIHRRRKAARSAISLTLNDKLWSIYRSNGANRYELTPEAKGRRALKNAALGYLMVGDAAEAVAACWAQFNDADNMTDRMAALAFLANSSAPERDKALAAFYERYRSDPLVIDKWFSVQAMSSRPDTLDRVIELRAHPDFNANNPNRLRSLIGAFGVNQVRFHAVDGAGYRFLGDEILAVGKTNPGAAARLSVPLGRWKRFDPVRSALMRAELERIMATPDLSKDVFEMVSKSLAG
ncbi:aminopeptidase N [Glacieibacterium megasporae]|uniref:aminopeptidase N n=1 Tax=Glacieibacterium megasporae TaxID=2835787 RepID=UPI001C1E3F13|nr:aminopeptidase N [Polymorphobacter megasporae]UAJ11771.1 aminopeptidase N [Polymorphobacter megasporae]